MVYWWYIGGTSSQKIVHATVFFFLDGVVLIAYKDLASYINGNFISNIGDPEENDLVSINSRVVSGATTSYAQETFSQPVIFRLVQIKVSRSGISPIHNNSHQRLLTLMCGFHSLAHILITEMLEHFSFSLDFAFTSCIVYFGTPKIMAGRMKDAKLNTLIRHTPSVPVAISLA